MEIRAFLTGVIATASLTSGIFFLKFWRETRDSFFLAFAISFIIEGFNRVTPLFLTHPNEGSPLIYLVRFLAFLLILAAILKKNFGRGAG